MMKIIFSILAILLFSNLIIAQTTAIPDPNFEQELINLGLDSGTPDGVVLTANINSIISLDVQNKNISDLTGIQDFVSLTNLYCGYNQLTSLDVTQNIALTGLFCYNNQLTSLDVTQNTSLTWLWCSNNQLAAIDITQNLNLNKFFCSSNLLTNIDVTQNLLLTDVDCGTNQLSSINVSLNTALIELFCDFNQLTNLDLSANSSLTGLYCDNNPFLSCLNIKNGNNINIFHYNIINNPNLTCVEVDDSIWATANLSFNIDPQTYYSNNCSNACSTLGVNDKKIEQVSIYPNPTTGNINIDFGEIKTNIKATLTNALGQIILSQQFESTDLFNIDIDAPTGIYFLKIETSKGASKTIKVLKK